MASGEMGGFEEVQLDKERRADIYIKDSEMNHSGSTQWKLLGGSIPKSQFVFAVQVVLIYIIVITSVVNLTINADESLSKIWIVLLSSCLGYLLPNPTIKKNAII